MGGGVSCGIVLSVLICLSMFWCWLWYVPPSSCPAAGPRLLFSPLRRGRRDAVPVLLAGAVSPRSRPPARLVPGTLLPNGEVEGLAGRREGGGAQPGYRPLERRGERAAHDEERSPTNATSYTSNKHRHIYPETNQQKAPQTLKTKPPSHFGSIIFGCVPYLSQQTIKAAKKKIPVSGRFCPFVSS